MQRGARVDGPRKLAMGGWVPGPIGGTRLPGKPDSGYGFFKLYDTHREMRVCCTYTVPPLTGFLFSWARYRPWLGVERAKDAVGVFAIDVNL